MALNGAWTVPRKANQAAEDQSLKSEASEALPKKRKRTGPFRIQTGCVVALRLRPELSDCRISVIERQSEANEKEVSLLEQKSITWDDEFTFVWTKPYVGRDEGLALIGKRIRCVFPKGDDNPTSKEKVLEGEIIRLVDYGDKQLRGTRRGFTVELLVGKKEAGLFSFLQHGCEGWETGVKSKRNKDLEERIRGKDTVSVMVNLMKPWWMACTADLRLDSEKKYATWTIEKLVPAKLFRRSANTIPKSDSNSLKTETTSKERRKSKGVISASGRYLGDGNDPADQQMANFEWTARRYYDILLSAKEKQENGSFNAELVSAGFCAQVVKVEPTPSNAPKNGTSTLAMVTLERFFLPEQTYSGRLPHDHALSVYRDHASVKSDRKYLLKVPVEHLVIISKKIHIEQNASDIQPVDLSDVLAALVVSYSYSKADDFYFPNSGEADLGLQPSPPCHRCRRIYHEDKNGGGFCRLEGRDSWLCDSCSSILGLIGNEAVPIIETCECRRCVHRRSHCWDADIGPRINTTNGELSANSLLLRACDKITELGSVDFQLPIMSTSAFPAPLGSVSTKVRSKGPPKVKRAGPGRPPKECTANVGAEQKKKRKRLSEKLDGAESDARQTIEDFSVFQPTCARFTPYDSSRKRRRETLEDIETRRDKPRNLREKDDEKNAGEVEKDEKTTSGRAARANQRRVLKGVASFGASATLSIDTLACREPQLRFDRSGIHAWGVFADEDIAAGEMILEYRGEIIGNSIAEKREVEYEAAKIGSDYMFRIDATTVCDATKQGCVARFINASCGPNCYTKIITLDGNKRIVIYAKRNIKSGEELCYDYKFPLEFDEAKRIPCYCGAKECRGYMNWDKKYVAIPSDSKVKTTGPNEETSKP